VSLESLNTIDAIAIDESSSEMILAILDNWTWENREPAREFRDSPVV